MHILWQRYRHARREVVNKDQKNRTTDSLLYGKIILRKLNPSPNYDERKMQRPSFLILLLRFPIFLNNENKNCRANIARGLWGQNGRKPRHSKHNEEKYVQGMFKKYKLTERSVLHNIINLGKIIISS